MVRGRRIGTTARWLAAGAGLAAGSYAAYAAATWYRYGRVTRQAAGEDRDPLLDQFMPTYDVVERHHVHVAAPAGITYEAATAMDLQQSSIARGLFTARTWIMRGQPAREPETRAFLSQMREIGWGTLAEIPGREVVMGAVTQPWMADVVFHALSPDRFAAFHEPGYVKIVWTLRADPIGPAASVFRTETRVATTDPVARAKFRKYWTWASPGIILIRWALLRPLKTEAERRMRAAAGSPAPEATR